MKIFNDIDQSSTIMKGELYRAEEVFNLPKSPGILLSKKEKLAKQKAYDDMMLFIDNLDSWNKNGFDVLATFLSVVEESIGKISLTEVNPKSLSFAFYTGVERIEVRLLPRIDKASHPMIVVKKDHVIKEYACDNMGKKGLLIDLISATIRREDKYVTRSFDQSKSKIRIKGLGYLTEITMPELPDNKKLLFDEEMLLIELLENLGTNDVIRVFQLLHLYAGEELTFKTTTIKTFLEKEESTSLSYKNVQDFKITASNTWEEIQMLKVFGSVLVKYEVKNPLSNPSAGVFTRTLNEDYDYLDRITGDIKEPETKAFFIEQQDRCEAFIAFLKIHTNKENKELTLTNNQ